MEQVLFFILMIGVLVVVHEFGHYLLARLNGVHVLEFAIGFGPKIFKIKGRSRTVEGVVLPPTVYSIGLLPFGGYVRMLGADPSEEVPAEIASAAFESRAVWQRFLVMAAGPAFNLLLALVLFFAIGWSTAELTSTRVGTIDQAGPAAAAGLLPGDRIVAVEGQEVAYFWQVVGAISDRYEAQPDGSFAPVPVKVAWLRGGERMEASVSPQIRVEPHIPNMPVLGGKPRARIGIGANGVRPMVAVEPGSVAEAAGLASWDRVVAVDGVRVDDLSQLLDILREGAGRSLELGVIRYEEVRASEIALGVGAGKKVVLPPSPETPLRGLGTTECLVAGVKPGSPAEALGLEAGDRLVSFKGERCSAWTFFGQQIALAGQEGGELVFDRGGELRRGHLAMAEVVWGNELKRDAQVLMHGIDVYFEDAPGELIPNEARLSYAWRFMWVGEGYSSLDGFKGVVTSVFSTLGALFSGDVKLEDSVMGPAGIAQVAGMSAERGWGFFFMMMAALSVNLGLINLLPVPMLDGGQILFLAIEGIRRKPVSMRLRMMATYAGLAFLVILMVIVTRNDLIRCLG